MDLYTTVKSTQMSLQQVYARMQALYVIKSALPLAIAFIRSDDASIDHLGERWATPISFKTERGELSISKYDEDRFINLNTAGDHPELFKEGVDVVMDHVGSQTFWKSVECLRRGGRLVFFWNYHRL